MNVVSWIHILLVAPWLMYVGFVLPGQTSTRQKQQQFLYTLTLALGVLVLLWHAWKAFALFTSQSAAVGRALFYLVHAVAFAPLLIYVGVKGPAAAKDASLLVGAVGLMSLLYHGVKLWKLRS